MTDGKSLTFAAAHTMLVIFAMLLFTAGIFAQDKKPNNVVPTWSPKGRIYFSMGPPENGDVYSTKADGTDLKLFIAGPGADYAPRWTHDGKRGVFMATRRMSQPMPQVISSARSR